MPSSSQKLQSSQYCVQNQRSLSNQFDGINVCSLEERCWWLASEKNIPKTYIVRLNTRYFNKRFAPQFYFILYIYYFHSIKIIFHRIQRYKNQKSRMFTDLTIDSISRGAYLRTTLLIYGAYASRFPRLE